MSFLGNLFGRRGRVSEPDLRLEPTFRPSDAWSFGPFSMSAFPGFAYVSGRAPAIYASARGDVAMITVNVLDGKPSGEVAHRIVANAKVHVTKVFASAAEKYSATPQEARERMLPSGDILLEMPLTTQDEKGAGHLLQYGVVSPIGNIAIITVEGAGAVSDAAGSLGKSIESARFAV